LRTNIPAKVRKGDAIHPKKLLFFIYH